MAIKINGIPTNLTEYPNSFKRQGAFPLEAYSVFQTEAQAKTYATSSPIAYVGQILACLDTKRCYMITDEEGTLIPLATEAFVDSALVNKADNVSPTFTGSPKAPTPPKGDDSTQIATTEFVNTALEDIEVDTYTEDYNLDNYDNYVNQTLENGSVNTSYVGDSVPSVKFIQQAIDAAISKINDTLASLADDV